MKISYRIFVFIFVGLFLEWSKIKQWMLKTLVIFLLTCFSLSELGTAAVASWNTELYHPAGIQNSIIQVHNDQHLPVHQGLSCHYLLIPQVLFDLHPLP